MKRHFKKRKKSCFFKSEKNVKYEFSNTGAGVTIDIGVGTIFWLGEQKLVKKTIKTIKFKV